jgi:hypothetical protein|tara:strand:+ start:611 stop:829 length:219 start_codon:yes stop_codon:yes gene_type:complete
MTNKEQDRIESAFLQKGFKRNPELSTSRYVTLEDEKNSVYISELGELAWESRLVENTGAEKVFQPVWRVAGV